MEIGLLIHCSPVDLNKKVKNPDYHNLIDWIDKIIKEILTS